MNHRTRIICQLSHSRRQFARGGSIRYFTLPLGSFVSPRSPLSPASLGWIHYLALSPRLTVQYASLYSLPAINKPGFAQNNESTVVLQVNMSSILFMFEYTFIHTLAYGEVLPSHIA